MILTSTDLHGDSTVEAKCLSLNFHVKFGLKCFRIITFCHNRINVRIFFVFLTPFNHVFQLKILKSYDMHTSSTLTNIVPFEIYQYIMIFV